MAIDIASAIGTVLYVRLWTRRETNQTARAGLESSDPAVCLAIDLLRASGGDPVETDGLACVARFSTLQAGILAARRLQWAAQGFSESETPVETAIAVVVQQGEDSPDPLAGGPLPAVLERAAPGQILITNNVGKELEETAGFSLGTASDTGFRELTWRGPDQHSTRSTDEMVISWFIEQKGPEFYSHAFAEEPVAAGSVKTDIAAVGRRNRQTNAEEAGEPESSHSGRQGRSRLIWSIGITATAVLLLAVVAVFRLFGGNEPEAGSSPAPATATSTPLAAGQSAPGGTTPVEVGRVPTPTRKLASPVQPPQSTLKLKPAEQKASPPAPQGQTESPAKVDAPVKPPKQPDSRCDLDPSQYSQEIVQAETNMGRGKYSAAARQFDAVLACDPGNARAREGRERVRQAQSAEEGPSQ